MSNFSFAIKINIKIVLGKMNATLQVLQQGWYTEL